MYHEKQRLQLCALHVLNNLFQKEKAFTKADLDQICLRLSPDAFINPHRSLLGLGNYDINVIMAALQSRDLMTVWFDKRKDVDCLELTSIKGLIVNMPYQLSIGFLKFPFSQKHWFVIREIDGTYFNLDSKLSVPEKIGDTGETLKYLKDILKTGDRELLLVVDSEVERTGSWKRIP